MAEGEARAGGPLPAEVQSNLKAYVDRLKASGVLTDPAVEQAFRRVPRHRFVERFFLRDEDTGAWTPVEHDPEHPQPEHAEQLAPSGLMLIPLRHAGANPLVRVWREDGEGTVGELLGQVVGFSGFIAVQGALADPAYSAAPPGRSVAPPADEERPLWPDLGDRRLDFWFYLGLRDPRTRIFRWAGSFGLADEATDGAARVEQDRLVGISALLDELDALHNEWRALGGPAMRHFRLRFVRADASVAPAPAPRPATGPWLLSGRYYYRQFALPPDQLA